MASTRKPRSKRADPRQDDPVVKRPAPVGDGTKKDQIVASIRDLIATGEMSRGERVQQDELAGRFDVSTTPVREALRQLQAEGLLVGEPHRGVRVAFADPDELRGIYIVRRLVEPYTMRRAAIRISRKDMQDARRLIDQLAEAQEEHDREGLYRANREFHFLLYERCGVPSLVKEIDHLWRNFPWDVLYVSGRASESTEEHLSILAALEGGDLDEVESATETHIVNGYTTLMKHLDSDRTTDPFDIESD